MVVPANRTFGLVACSFFALLAGLPLLSGGGMRLWALALAAFLGVVSIVKPSALAGLNILWARFGELLHTISNPVILAIIFYAVLSPFGIVMRLFRKTPLDSSIDPSAESYWIARDPHERTGVSMINQF